MSPLETLAVFPIYGIVNSFKELVPDKIFTPTVVSVSGNTKLGNEDKPLIALFPIETIESPISKLFILEQYAKARSSIVVTLSGSVNDSNDKQP